MEKFRKIGSIGAEMSTTTRMSAASQILARDRRRMPRSRPGADRKHRRPADHRHQKQLMLHRDMPAEQAGEPGIDLIGAEAERGGEPKHRGDDGDHIGELAWPASDAVADQGTHGGADGQRLALAEREIGEDQPGNRVERPRHEPPMKEGDLHGHAGAHDARRVGPPSGDQGVARIMGEGFGDGPEHEPDAHPGRKQHRRPG